MPDIIDDTIEELRLQARNFAKAAKRLRASAAKFSERGEVGWVTRTSSLEADALERVKVAAEAYILLTHLFRRYSMPNESMAYRTFYVVGRDSGPDHVVRITPSMQVEDYRVDVLPWDDLFALLYGHDSNTVPRKVDGEKETIDSLGDVADVDTMAERLEHHYVQYNRDLLTEAFESLLTFRRGLSA